MCYVVDSECIIANAFFVKKEKNSLNLQELHRAISKVSASIAKYNAIVNWTKSELASACVNYRHIFIIKDQAIVKSPGFREDGLTEDYVNTVFNAALEPQIISEMRQTLKAHL